jgi:hypothetical protein
MFPDFPSSNRLGLLAFHIALVRNPQETSVVWAFSSLLYFGTWSEALSVKQVDGNKKALDFYPEIRCDTKPMSEKILKEKVLNLASLVSSSVQVFSCAESLQEYFTVFSEAREFSGQVCIQGLLYQLIRVCTVKGANLYPV